MGLAPEINVMYVCMYLMWVIKNMAVDIRS